MQRRGRFSDEQRNECLVGRNMTVPAWIDIVGRRSENSNEKRDHLLPASISLRSNAPVSGAAAELYNPAGHSPRPLYWQVRRLVAFPKELILRHATRRGGPMAHVRARARHADDLPGDAALRQHRFFR